MTVRILTAAEATEARRSARDKFLDALDQAEHVTHLRADATAEKARRTALATDRARVEAARWWPTKDDA